MKVFETLQEVFDLCVIERIETIYEYFGVLDRAVDTCSHADSSGLVVGCSLSEISFTVDSAQQLQKELLMI